MGFGYLETQQKIQVHFLMLLARLALRPRRRALPLGLLLPARPAATARRVPADAAAAA